MTGLPLRLLSQALSLSVPEGVTATALDLDPLAQCVVAVTLSRPRRVVCAGRSRAVGREGVVPATTGPGRRHHCSPASAIRAASSIAPAFINVSWYSASGSESATIPPPAWKCTVLPFTTMVRRVMQVSIVPEKLK